MTPEQREAEDIRLTALIDRWANYLMQGRNGDDTEGEAANRLYLRQLVAQREALRAGGSGE